MTSANIDWKALIKDHLSESGRPLICILGPTASGKTTFSIEVSHWLQTELGLQAEVINADSRQLFRGMDIGTGKIRSVDMEGIPHHMLDQLDPNELPTAAWYQQNVKNIIASLHDQAKIPLLVGGSMLYIASITDDLQFGKTEIEELRNPDAVCPYDLLVLGLGSNRDETVVKINNRTDLFFEDGWIDEVQSLLDAGYTISDPGMKACGYREIAAYLNGDIELESLQEDIKAKTRQYARRQMTWWKGDTRIHWLS